MRRFFDLPGPLDQQLASSQDHPQGDPGRSWLSIGRSIGKLRGPAGVNFDALAACVIPCPPQSGRRQSLHAAPALKQFGLPIRASR
jgi:hypothetical protein